MSSGILAFVSTFFAAAISAPLFARAALHFGVVDSPDGHRKLHERPVPLTGGPTLLLSTIVGVAVTLFTYPDLLASTAHDMKFLTGLFLAGSLIVGIGLVDDRFGMRGRQKLLGQIIAAAILLPTGIIVREVSVFGILISFGDLAPLFTLAVLVGGMNALNLIDGVDGLACTTGIVLSISVAAVTWIYQGRPDGLLVAMVLAGGLCGFLLHNFPPARMFLGDSGSMLIGLILGAVALKCSLKQLTATTLMMPAAIWAIPLFDVSMAIVRRKLTGRSIYQTDRGHLHHCLARKGVNGRWLLVLMAALCSLTGLGAVVATILENDLIAFAGIFTAIAILVLTRSFGHAEARLFYTRLRRIVGSLVRRAAPVHTVLHDENVHLNGKEDWQNLWSTLTEFAETFNMAELELFVQLPQIGEEYHASWKAKTALDVHEHWKSDIPLIIDGICIGQLRVAGDIGAGSVCTWISDIIGGLEGFEAELAELVADLRQKRGLAAPEKVVLRESDFALTNS